LLRGEKSGEGRLRATTRAFRHRNFQLYFIGMLISVIGTWMQSVAQSWLVYRLTDSPFLLGLTGFAGQIPVFVLAPFGGVVADRYSRHKIIVLTQTLSLVQAGLLAWLTLTGAVTVNAILVLALMLGAINAFDMPARQAFLIELVGKDELMNAIALNSSMFNGARIVGPALAGAIVALVGEGQCFLLNAVSFIAVIAGLLAMRLEPTEITRPVVSAFSSLKEGLAYVLEARPIRALLIMVALVSVFGIPYSVLMPIFAKRVLGGGPQTLGILLGAGSIGALGGALMLAARSRVEGLGRLVAMNIGAFGVMLMLFALSSNLVLSTLLMVPAGFTIMVQLSGTNTLLQTIVPDEMRGRVMSFYSVSLIGMSTFGSLISGKLASYVGAPKTVWMGGAICLGGALIFRLRFPSIRKAMKPELASPAALDGDPGQSPALGPAVDYF
jgi:MFS family permease